MGVIYLCNNLKWSGGGGLYFQEFENKIVGLWVFDLTQMYSYFYITFFLKLFLKRLI